MPPRDQLVGFGPYLYDLELGRLSQAGQVTQLPEQAARMLTYLIQKSGKLATRQELRSAVWLDAPPSDIEQAINKRISQLRTLLCDNVDQPLYIETIPQRGYRFCAEVHHPGLADDLSTDSSELEFSQPTPLPSSPPVDLIVPGTVTTAPVVPVESSRSRRVWLAVAIPVALLLLVAVTLLVRHARAPLPASSAKTTPAQITLALAPFEAADSQSTEVATDLRSDLIDRLAASPHLRVIASNSSKGLRTDSTLNAQAARLGLDLVVFGYLSSEGGIFHLRLELMRPTDSSHVATFNYKANTAQWDHLRNEATNDILTRMNLQAPSGADIGGTSNPKAFELYMHGRGEASKLSDEGKDYGNALADYREAVRLDPNFGNAYTALARTVILLGARGLMPKEACFAEAQHAVDQALRISPSLPAAHSVLSQLLMYRDWNFTEAEREATLATQLQFGSGPAHIDLAWAFVLNRNYPAALNEIAVARTIDPFNPALDYNEMFVGYGLHDCKRVLTLSDGFVSRMPNLPSALSLAAWGYLVCGRQTQSIAVLRKVAGVFNDPKWEAFEEEGLKVWQKGGDKPYAQSGLHAYQTHSVSKAFEDNLNEEEWASLAGNDKLAMQLIKQRADAHDNQFLTDLLSPALLRVRQTPEFQSLLRAVTR